MIARRVFAFVSALFIVAAAAADDPKPPPAATTTADPAIAVEDLTLICEPLTKAELEIEASAWLGVLKSKLQEISDKKLKARHATVENYLKRLDPAGSATGDEKTKLEKQAAESAAADKAKFADEASKAETEDRPRLVDRLNAVLAALRAKGGKSDDYDTYVNAISGVKLNVNVTDAHQSWTFLVNWLKSPEGGIRYAKNVVLFLLTLFVFRVLSGIIGSILRRTLQSIKTLSSLLRDFVVNAAQKVVFFVGFVMALSYLEVNIGPFLAAMGAAGFVIGFALQGTLSNFASGVMILLYRPYDLGDTVTVAGATGKVAAMTLVSTMVLNADGHAVTIPNSSIWGGTITNLSAGAGKA